MRKNDIEILKIIHDYGILSLTQLSSLCFPSRQMARRKIRELSKRGLIEIMYQYLGKSTGRPEQIISLNEQSLQILKKTNDLSIT